MTSFYSLKRSPHSFSIGERVYHWSMGLGTVVNVRHYREPGSYLIAPRHQVYVRTKLDGGLEIETNISKTATSKLRPV
jgi:hypothetical protein